MVYSYIWYTSLDGFERNHQMQQSLIGQSSSDLPHTRMFLYMLSNAGVAVWVMQSTFESLINILLNIQKLSMLNCSQEADCNCLDSAEHSLEV